VIRQMVQTGFIGAVEAERAMAAPVNPAKPAKVEARQAAFFEDIVTQQLRTLFSERQLHFGGLRVYTTLDLDLQRAAAEAARAGSAELDRQVKRPKHAAPMDFLQPQLTLIALDPHSGDVKALIGGREIRCQPIEPRDGTETARIGIQALCVCGCPEFGGGRFQAHHHARHTSER